MTRAQRDDDVGAEPANRTTDSSEIKAPNNIGTRIHNVLSHPTIPGWTLIVTIIGLFIAGGIGSFFLHPPTDQPQQSVSINEAESLSEPNTEGTYINGNEDGQPTTSGTSNSPSIEAPVAGGPNSRREPPQNVGRFNQDLVIRLQRALDSAGYEPGTDDGVLGVRTWSAAERFANDAGIPLPNLTSATPSELQSFIFAVEREAAAANERNALSTSPDRSDLTIDHNELEPGTVFRDCTSCPEMVVLPTGSFSMGSPQNEIGREVDEDDMAGPGGSQVTISIEYPFAIGVYEVSQEQWAACVESGICRNESVQAHTTGRGLRGYPVVNVSWIDAQAYVAFLRSETDEPYRLLSEAEWEYAARAGEQLVYTDANGIEPTAANFGQPYAGGLMPSGSYEPNAFGVYDLFGNAWEWVEDCYQGSYSGLPSSGAPRTRPNCPRRVIRGGGWDGLPKDVRPANRGYERVTNRTSVLGFRVARDF